MGQVAGREVQLWPGKRVTCSCGYDEVVEDPFLTAEYHLRGHR